jgi:hypothetical protein
MNPEDDNLHWLDEFADLADNTLGEGSACDQIHPIVERWLYEWLDSDMPTPRSSVSQALACLATEVLNNAPERIANTLTENCDEDDVLQWIQAVLITGQAFQSALDTGQLDDL